MNMSKSKKKPSGEMSEPVSPTSTQPSTTPTSSTSTPSVVHVTGVSLDTHELSLSFGAEHLLKATVAPSDAANQLVSWSSSNNEVATVRNGRVISNSTAGQTTITVTTDDGSFTDFCVVTVADTDVAVTGVNIPYDNVSVDLGKSVTIAKNIEPSNAKNQSVTWCRSHRPSVRRHASMRNSANRHRPCISR